MDVEFECLDGDDAEDAAFGDACEKQAAEPGLGSPGKSRPPGSSAAVTGL